MTSPVLPGNTSTLRVSQGLDTTSCMVRFGWPFTQSLSRTKFLRSALSASSETREIHLGCFRQPNSSSLHRLHLLLMSGCQKNQHRPPWSHLQTTCLEKPMDVPVTLQASTIPMPPEIHAPNTCITTCLHSV